MDRSKKTKHSGAALSKKQKWKQKKQQRRSEGTSGCRKNEASLTEAASAATTSAIVSSSSSTATVAVSSVSTSATISAALVVSTRISPTSASDSSPVLATVRSLHVCSTPWRAGTKSAPVQLCTTAQAKSHHRSILAILNRITDTKIELLIGKSLDLIFPSSLCSGEKTRQTSPISDKDNDQAARPSRIDNKTEESDGLQVSSNVEEKVQVQQDNLEINEEEEKCAHNKNLREIREDMMTMFFEKAQDEEVYSRDYCSFLLCLCSSLQEEAVRRKQQQLTLRTSQAQQQQGRHVGGGGGSSLDAPGAAPAGRRVVPEELWRRSDSEAKRDADVVEQGANILVKQPAPNVGSSLAEEPLEQKSNSMDVKSNAREEVEGRSKTNVEQGSNRTKKQVLFNVTETRSDKNKKEKRASKSRENTKDRRSDTDRASSSCTRADAGGGFKTEETGVHRMDALLYEGPELPDVINAAAISRFHSLHEELKQLYGSPATPQPWSKSQEKQEYRTRDRIRVHLKLLVALQQTALLPILTLHLIRDTWAASVENYQDTALLQQQNLLQQQEDDAASNNNNNHGNDCSSSAANNAVTTTRSGSESSPAVDPAPAPPVRVIIIEVLNHINPENENQVLWSTVRSRVEFREPEYDGERIVLKNAPDNFQRVSMEMLTVYLSVAGHVNLQQPLRSQELSALLVAAAQHLNRRQKFLLERSMEQRRLGWIRHKGVQRSG